MDRARRKKKKREMPRYKRILRYWCWNLSKGLRLRERIDHANNWSLTHPQQFIKIIIGVASFLLVITVLSLAISLLQDNGNEDSQEDGTFLTSAVQDMQPTLDGMRQIRNHQKVENIELKNLTERGLQKKSELDSLLALPYKSHDDSVRIVTDYRQIEDIVQFLKKTRNEQN